MGEIPGLFAEGEALAELQRALETTLEPGDSAVVVTASLLAR